MIRYKTLSETTEISNDKKNAINRIRMERETQGLSYYDIELLLHDSTLSSEYIRKAIESGRIDDYLLDALNKVLGINPDDKHYSQTVTAYRYNKARKLKSGRMSKKDIAARKELRTSIEEKLKKNNNESEEEAIIQSSKERYFYDGIECDEDMYYELMDEDIIIEKLKTLFLINELFPEEVDDFIDNFELDESDKEYLKNIDIKIHY